MAKHNNARLGRRGDLTARNFPSAQQEATIKAPPSRYDGPESSYRLAFTDTEFLLREELRPVRMQLELLKPEMVQAEQSIQSTIVIFGSARIVSSDVAERLITDARSAKDETALRIAETHRSMARYYDEARRFASIVTTKSRELATPIYVVTGGGPEVGGETVSIPLGTSPAPTDQAAPPPVPEAEPEKPPLDVNACGGSVPISSVMLAWSSGPAPAVDAQARATPDPIRASHRCMRSPAPQARHPVTPLGGLRAKKRAATSRWPPRRTRTVSGSTTSASSCGRWRPDRRCRRRAAAWYPARAPRRRAGSAG